MFYRSDNRSPDQLRPVTITPNFISTAEGSVLIEVGNTRVICTASIEEAVPQFMRNRGKGWISSEYSMLPRGNQGAFILLIDCWENQFVLFSVLCRVGAASV